MMRGWHPNVRRASPVVTLSLAFLPLAAVVTDTSAAQSPRTIYISADMEGIAGLSDTQDAVGRRLMTLEVNAAVVGAFEGGATSVVVNDAHGSHANLLQEDLDPRARLLRGSLKPYGMMQGLEASHAGVVFIGYHGRAGSLGSFAAHTGSGRVADLRVNGRSVGEGGMNLLYAAWYRVPVIFVSGDDVAVQQVREMVPGVTGVPVKTGIWNSAVVTLSPDSARAVIRRGVADAVREIASRPQRPGSPFNVELEYASSLFADIAEGIPGVARRGPTTVAFSDNEYPAAYRMIRVLYKHLQP